MSFIFDPVGIKWIYSRIGANKVSEVWREARVRRQGVAGDQSYLTRDHVFASCSNHSPTIVHSAVMKNVGIYKSYGQYTLNALPLDINTRSKLGKKALGDASESMTGSRGSSNTTC